VALLKGDGGSDYEAEAELKGLMEANIARLFQLSPPHAKALSARFQSLGKKKIKRDDMAAGIMALLSDPPAGLFPEDKLVRVIETVRESGGRGVMIFAATHLFRNKLWEA